VAPIVVSHWLVLSVMIQYPVGQGTPDRTGLVPSTVDLGHLHVTVVNQPHYRSGSIGPRVRRDADKQAKVCSHALHSITAHPRILGLRASKPAR